jgi:hypothetical protein
VTPVSSRIDKADSAQAEAQPRSPIIIRQASSFITYLSYDKIYSMFLLKGILRLLDKYKQPVKS